MAIKWLLLTSGMGGHCEIIFMQGILFSSVTVSAKMEMKMICGTGIFSDWSLINGS